VADTNGFVAGIARVLKGEGVAVIEAPYVKDLVDHCEFDTIYHEHLCYFSVTALDALFRRHGLFINQVKRLSIHGGSLRIYAEKREGLDKVVEVQLPHPPNHSVDPLGLKSAVGKASLLAGVFRAATPSCPAACIPYACS
jgi:hypothetical protein